MEGLMLGDQMSVVMRDGVVWYFHHSMPVYSHAEKDLASFRLYTSQLCDSGQCKLVDVHRVFGVTEISVKRAVKQFREEGAGSFFISRQPKVKPRVLTPEINAKVQVMLDEGMTMKEAGRLTGINADTIRFAVRSGRLHRPAPKKESGGASVVAPLSTKSERSVEDQAAASGLGVACHDVLGRTLAAVGQGGPVQPVFAESVVDVPGAGVLCAVPALLVNGLLHGTEKHFTQPKGYYPLTSLFLLFAYLSLARVRSLEKVRYLPPGEWGKMLGLDRIPEVRTLREKLEVLTQLGNPEKHAAEMSEFWMQGNENLAGILYVDGHVRTYHGSQTELPRRYSSRDRICMHSFMDYWVNDMKGTPFFVVPVVGTEGMIHHLKAEIIPRLLRDVPGQPGEEELAQNPELHRFTIVMDREGYSPAFFANLWAHHRIAIQTYRKGKIEPWPVEAFSEQEVVSPHGNKSLMFLTERTVDLKGAEGIPVREIRRLSPCRTHQTAILTTDRLTKMPLVAAHMFARWDQENFFKYGEKEFAIDHLPGYGLCESPDTETVRNPAFNQFETEIKRCRAERFAILKKRDKIVLTGMPDAKAIEEHYQQMAPFNQALADLDKKMAGLKEQRKNTAKRIKIGDLPEDQQPKLVAPRRIQFLNTIHIMAYRAETTMASILREHLSRPDDARALLQDLYKHDADIIPDPKAGLLTVRVHHFTNPQAGRAIAALLACLNETETVFPGTQLTLRYELVSSPSPPDQEV